MTSISHLLRIRRPALARAVAIFSGFWAINVSISVSVPDSAQPLQESSQVERSLAAGESHEYTVTVQEGDFLDVLVEQRGTDVKVALLSTDSMALAEIDSPNGRNGPERLLYLATRTGALRLVVSSAERGAPAGLYRLRIEALRRPAPEDHRRLQAWNLVKEGDQLKRGTSPEKLRAAIDSYQRAFDIFTQTGDTYQQPILLNRIGLIHASLGEAEVALERYRRALTLWEATGDPYGQAMALTSIGAALEATGRPREALESYQRVLGLLEKLQEPQPHATLLNNMGWVLFTLGDPDQALEVLRKTIEFRKQGGDLKGEAITLLNMAVIFESIGDYDPAIANNSRALAIGESIADNETRATALNNLGTDHWALGDADSALSFYSQALKLAEEDHRRRLEETILSNMGVIFSEQRRFDQALATQEKALQLTREIADRRGEATILHNIADVHERQQKWKEAQAVLEEALQIWREVGFKSGESATTHQLGKAAEKLGDTATARRLYESALILAREVADRVNEINICLSLANLDRKSGNLERAIPQAENALRIIESIRASIGLEKSRQSYFQTHRSLIELYLNVLTDLDQRQPGEGYARSAFQTSERARVRTLLDNIPGSGARIRKGADAVLLQQEGEIQRHINELENKRRASLRRKAPQEEIARLDAELDDLLKRLDQVRSELRIRSPKYSALMQPEPQTLEQIQAELGPDTLLLSYFLGEERSFVWAVTNSSLTARELPPRREIELAAEELHTLLSRSDQRLALSPTMRVASRLAGMLLGPVKERLRQSNRLVIIADGALHYIPFAALPAPDKPIVPLVVEHEIVNLPSASVLAILRRETADRSPGPRKVAVLADPVFDSNDPRLKLQAGASPAEPSAEALLAQRAAKDVGLDGFPRLRYTREEAEGIASLLPPGEVFKALDFDASKETATGGKLARYRILHFATHGLLDTRRPELSGLVLSLIDRQGRPRDGFLRLHEIYNLDLPSDLVVLSGCETALGKEVRGEGLIALTRGFMYAGAPSVVASLWRVDDRSTAELMRRFYRALLKQGLPPASALRTAQVSLAKEKPTSAPYFWAGFVFQGDWRKAAH